MSSFNYAFKSLYRNGWRTTAYLSGLALAVALFSSTLFFIDGSARSMTQRAAAPVYLDFQARAVDSKTDVTAFASQLTAQPGVRVALPFVAGAVNIITGSVSSGTYQPAVSTDNNPVSNQLPARLFAFPPNYLDQFPLLRLTSGQFGPGAGEGSTLVSEQLAVSLHLKIGDSLRLAVPGLNQPYLVRVGGTVNTDYADPLFSGPTATPEGSYNFAAAVVVLDYATFSRDLAGPFSAAAVATATAGPAPGPASSNSQFGLPLLDRQVHINIDRNRLPSDPGEAQLAIGNERRFLERQLPGQLKITDNLTSALKNAAADVVSARLLFIFLGLPGVLLAAYLSRYAASLVIEAQRREVALLRARGFSPALLRAIMGWSTVLIALLSTLLGLVVAAASTAAIFGAQIFTNFSSLVLSALAAVALGLGLGGLGIYLPARQMLKAEINEERRIVTAVSRPLWLRLPLDFILLALAALALWFSTTYNSKTATAGASETAAVSLGIYSFIGPLLFWLGAALLFNRLLDWLLGRPPRPHWRGGIYGLARRTLYRRRRRSVDAALLVALALGFGVAITTFGATYQASRQAEARYIVGSDLRITPALTNPQPASFASRLAETSQLQAVTAVGVTNNALVGSQTQTVYGIDVPSFRSATNIPDDFFGPLSGGATSVLNQLAATPNGLLVSNELANSYNIVSGDTVNLRLPTVEGGYSDVKLTVIGIFTMFPTSSQNSDLVVNLDYLTKTTHDSRAGFFLARTDGTTRANTTAATDLINRFKAQGLAIRIEQADRVISQDQSSLAGLNLSALVTLDRVFAVLIITVGLGVFLLGSVLERQRELATLQAVGATRWQVTRLLLLEGSLLVASGIVGGLLTGLAVAWQYNTFLPSIFAVALPIITVPLIELGGFAVFSLLGVGLAALLMLVRLGRLWPAQVLREANAA